MDMKSSSPKDIRQGALFLWLWREIPAAPYVGLGDHCRVDDDRRQHGGRASLDDAASL